MRTGSIFGTHRVLGDDIGKLPQAAWKLDNDKEIYNNELLVEVEMLNIDSASFHQILKETNNDEKKLEEKILEIIETRGKMHNPVTSSGGVLIGRVKEIGEDYVGRAKIGDLIISLVSLSLTPLHIDSILKTVLEREQLFVKGHAILFQSSNYYVIEDDKSIEKLLSILDVAGAPAQTSRLVRENHTVFISGAGGKSGLLSLYTAKQKVKNSGKIIALVFTDEEYELVQSTGLANLVLKGDATKPVSILNSYKSLVGDDLADVSINCTNVPNTEMSSIIVTKERGIVYFFNMATSFSAAALGAEGISKDIDLLIGNGYMENHVDIAIKTSEELEQLLNVRGL